MIRAFKISLIAVLFSYSGHLYAQYLPYKIPVTVKNKSLNNAWAGGFNCPQFSSIDLNGDNLLDLFTFDRSGDKLRTFINKGKINMPNFEYAPEYEKYFPAMTDFALLADYDKDGKNDIFTYYSGSITVYKNYSSTGFINFQKTYKTITTRYYTPDRVGIFVSPVHQPALCDIDNDGDLDILSYSVSSFNVEYNRNISQQKYGNADSLLFERYTYCWGDFAGANQVNSVNLLDSTCIKYRNTRFRPIAGGNNGEPAARIQHGGASLLALDTDGDGDKDLIIGDATDKNLIFLKNGGTPDSASMTSVDLNFPANSHSSVITTYPAPYYVDVDNDGLRDLIVSPTYNGQSENINNVFYYKNTGTANNVIFTFQKRGFLQDEMIDVGINAYPILFDYDKDGLLDLFVGGLNMFDTTGTHPGRIALYKNTGTISKPAFTLTDENFATTTDLNRFGISPTFGDIDGDGDNDMLIGEENGGIFYYENIAPTGQAPNYQFVNSGGYYQGIDVGENSHPCLIDLNKDGLLDLVIGNRYGFLSYYQNTGSASNPVFTLISNKLGNVDTRQTGNSYANSYPAFYQENGKNVLLVGTLFGNIYRYGNIDGNLNGTFTKLDSAFVNINAGAYASPTMADLDNDGKPELLVGNQAGGIYLFSQSILSVESLKINQNADYIQLYPNPANHELNISFAQYAIKGLVSLQIMNILGQPVYTWKGNADETLHINTEALPEGLYLCQTKFNGQSTSHRFIIQH
jgi:hypothetical protein